MSSGSKRGFSDRVQDGAIDTFKGYVAIIAVVLLFGGAAAAASVAGTIAVVVGTSLGIGAGELGVFAKSVVTGHDMTKGSEDNCASLTDCIKDQQGENKTNLGEKKKGN